MPDASLSNEWRRPARRLNADTRNKPENEKPTQNFRITKSTKAFMLTVAIIGDLLSLIPLVNDFVQLFALPIFFVWFKFKGVNMFGTKSLTAQITASIIEFIPIASVLPALTFAMWKTIKISRMEDLVAQNPIANKTINSISRLSGKGGENPAPNGRLNTRRNFSLENNYRSAR